MFLWVYCSHNTAVKHTACSSFPLSVQHVLVNSWSPRLILINSYPVSPLFYLPRFIIPFNSLITDHFISLLLSMIEFIYFNIDYFTLFFINHSIFIFFIKQLDRMNSSGTARENQTESRHSHTNIGNNKPIRLALPHTRWRRKKKKEKDMWKRMDVGERKGERKECVWICIRNMNREKKQFNRDWSTSLRYSSGRSEYRLKSANLHIAQTDKT